MSDFERVVVTGACGFIGTALSRRLIRQDIEVIGIDDLSRRGACHKAEDLAAEGGFSLHRLGLERRGDILELFARLGRVDAVFHLAGQVAVTASYVDRERDFQSNVVGTFNLLEAVRRYCPDAYCLYASTNKVYGQIKVQQPVGFDRPLDPCTPYGVSKAAAELYFTEYARPETGLATCSLRQSCIYGPDQFGVEDQGWFAWFAIANVLGLPICIYGSGEQVRDLLFVEDLIDLYLECFARRLVGVFPVGGGAANAICLTGALDLISHLTKKPFVAVQRSSVRPGDQPYFVADLGWTTGAGVHWYPRVEIEEGAARMLHWIQRNEEKIRTVLVCSSTGS
jgi:CDP-paratose 2-epimerase